MFIKTTIRLAVLASALALTTAAPVAFAQMASPDGGQTNATSGRNNDSMMQKKDMTYGTTGYTGAASPTNSSSPDGGATNVTKAPHHKKAMHKKMHKARNAAVPIDAEKSTGPKY